MFYFSVMIFLYEKMIDLIIINTYQMKIEIKIDITLNNIDHILPSTFEYTIKLTRLTMALKMLLYRTFFMRFRYLEHF